MSLSKTIFRIYHEYEGRMEKSFPRIAIWHPEACYPHTNNGFFILLTAVFIYLFI